MLPTEKTVGRRRRLPADNAPGRGSAPTTEPGNCESDIGQAARAGSWGQGPQWGPQAPSPGPWLPYTHNCMTSVRQGERAACQLSCRLVALPHRCNYL